MANICFIILASMTIFGTVVWADECPVDCSQRPVPDVSGCCPTKIALTFDKCDCALGESKCYVDFTSTKPNGYDKISVDCQPAPLTDNCAGINCEDFHDDPDAEKPQPEPEKPTTTTQSPKNEENTVRTKSPNQAETQTQAPATETVDLPFAKLCTMNCDSTTEECIGKYCICKMNAKCGANLYKKEENKFCELKAKKCTANETCILNLFNEAFCITTNAPVAANVNDRCIDGVSCPNVTSPGEAAKCMNKECYCTTSYCEHYPKIIEDKARCKNNKKECHKNAECYVEINAKTKTVTVDCVCNDGYEGDGITCTEKKEVFRCLNDPNPTKRCAANETCLSDGFCYCEKDKVCTANANEILEMAVCEFKEKDLTNKTCGPTAKCTYNNLYENATCHCNFDEKFDTEAKTPTCIAKTQPQNQGGTMKKSKKCKKTSDKCGTGETCMQDNYCYCDKTSATCDDNENLIVLATTCPTCPTKGKCVTFQGGSAGCKCEYGNVPSTDGSACVAKTT